MTEHPAQVGIVIPVYGHFDLLEACLRSILAQDGPAWRAVVVDDGSPQGRAADVVAALGDPRITTVRHDVNRGLAASRNTGVQHLDTPWILPFDGDDLMPPGALSALWHGVQSPDIDCVFGDLELFGTQSGRLRYVVRPPGTIVFSQWLPGAGTLMRRALWARTGGWSELDIFRFGNEDWDFWLGVTAAGPFKAVHVDALTYRYRRRAASLSLSSMRDNEWQTRLAMVERHPTVFGQYGGARAFVWAGVWKTVRARLRAGHIGGAWAHWREAWSGTRGRLP